MPKYRPISVSVMTTTPMDTTSLSQLQSDLADLEARFALHAHTGYDQTQKVGLKNLADLGVEQNVQYSSGEYDNGNCTGTATIDWIHSNVQYATLTGDCTFTFKNPLAGGRYLLHIAGGYTPTFPGTVRWSNGVTPTPTVTAGQKDLYTFVYSAKEGLYDGLLSTNFSIT